MNETLGQILRTKREELGWDISHVSSYLKIKAADIEALEKEDWENITRHLYRPGLVKSYARMLKIEVGIIEEKLKSVSFESNVQNQKYKLINIGEDVDLTPNKDMFLNFLLISILFFLVMLAIYNSDESNSKRVLGTPDLVNAIEKIPE